MSAELFARRRFEGIGLYAVGVLCAVGFHAGLSMGASTLKSKPKPVRVEMAVVRTRPTPPPPPEPKPAPEPKARPKPKPRQRTKRLVKPPPQQQLPPPTNSPPPTDQPSAPVPIVTGISMASTVKGGAGLRVRVGNTLYGDVDKEAFTAPEAVKPYAGGFTPVKTHEITEEPEVLREVKASMPAEAKRAGVQGAVVLRVEVTRRGSVRGVRLIKGLGYGLDQAAMAAMRKYKFRPARRDGEPVDYTISRFYYVFELVS